MSQNEKGFLQNQQVRKPLNNKTAPRNFSRKGGPSPRWTHIIGLLGLACMTLQYQNCAPAGNSGSTTSASLASSADSSPVSVIDNPNGVSAGGNVVSFQQRSVQLHADVQSVVLIGSCPADQDGAIFKWELDGVSGDELGQGLAHCSAGQFQVEIAPTQELVCGQSYSVTARMGVGAAAQVSVQRLCAAAASVSSSSAAPEVRSQLSAQLSAHPDSSCQLESRPGDGKTGCMSVCYSHDGLVESSEDLPVSACVK